jgi:hypothetical protein
MVTIARRKAEARKKRGHAWQLCSAVLMALIPAIVPKSPTFIVVSLIVVFLVGIQAARYGYVDRPSRRTLAIILLGHAVVLALFGWWVWPIITVSPSHISFAGYPNETFNFSIRNGRADDVYDVQIPFLIGYNKHLEDKLSAKVAPNGDPPQRIYDDYNYCFGKKGDVSKVLPNEREVLIVRIGHLAPYAVGSFSIMYAGGEKLEAKSGTLNFITEPYSYSSMQATMGVRGDYRICKYVISTDGGVQK